MCSVLIIYDCVFVKGICYTVIARAEDQHRLVYRGYASRVPIEVSRVGQSEWWLHMLCTFGLSDVDCCAVGSYLSGDEVPAQFIAHDPACQRLSIYWSSAKRKSKWRMLCLSIASRLQSYLFVIGPGVARRHLRLL